MILSDDTSLGEAKAWLRDRVDDGAGCPCCTQFAKVYRRKINSTMARALITLYRHSTGDEFVHTAGLPGDTHEMSQFAWWGLVEEEKVRRPDGGRAGWWRITELGREYVMGRLRLPRYALIYDSRLLRLDESETAGIRDALGTRFDLAELMGWR